jgi:hypothetical protein
MRARFGIALSHQTTNPKFLARPEQQNGISVPAAAAIDVDIVVAIVVDVVVVLEEERGKGEPKARLSSLVLRGKKLGSG